MKIAIIGGGINGLYLANKLAKNGHNITIFDKKKAIGDNIVCSGLFSKRVLEYFPTAESLILNRINSVNIHFPKKTINISFSKPFFVMEHSELDKLAAKLCVNNGVKIELEASVKELPKKDFDKIIGCDGAFSMVRKQLKLKNPKYRIGINGFINKPDKNDFVNVWPIKEGFIWKIPRGENIEYGIIGNPVTAIVEFQKFLKKNEIYIPKFQSKIIPQGLELPFNDKITLCGDAAGLTKPWSGGGVIWGFRAADILVKTFPHFRKYQVDAKFFFGRKILLSKIALWGVYWIGFKLPWLMPKNAKIESDYLF